ncbi:hypothetical protein KDL01_06070 [Actinospica durhamensis]|uniref:Lipoprotein n=1 Tax=Actinospica durhamensis TaxID=1508375 RepID=A0A941EM02_9ACTN|nr:hypothetical protein [Actinospica durhamensis]MBR7832818.1 hypothetical protein [Actinospica durhamensis]
MGTEHVGRSLFLGAVAAMALAVAGCSGGSGHPSSLLSFGPTEAGGAGATTTPSTPSTASATGSGADAGASAASVEASPTALASSTAAGRTTSVSVGGGYASSALPASVWTNPSAIPLDAAYHWRSPAAVDKKASAPILTAVQDCQLALSTGDRSELAAFPAAQADLTPTSGGTGGRDDWSAQETVLATGDTSSGDIQGIYMLYGDLVASVGKCAASASGAKLTNVSSSSAGYAATLTIPTSTGTTLTVHEYLAAPYGYLVELSVWVAPYAGDKPSAAWNGASSGTVLAALSAGPCALSKAC